MKPAFVACVSATLFVVCAPTYAAAQDRPADFNETAHQLPLPPPRPAQTVQQKRIRVSQATNVASPQEPARPARKASNFWLSVGYGF